MTRVNEKPRRRGAAAVEFAMICPVFLMVLFGIFEYGRFLMVLQVLNNAAREGGRYAVVNTGNASTTDNAPTQVSQTTIQNKVNNYLAGMGTQLTGFTPTGVNSVASIKVYRADPGTGANITGDNTLGWATDPPTGTNSQTGAAYQRGQTPIMVEIQGDYQPILPLFLFMPSPIHVDAKVAMYSEGN